MLNLKRFFFLQGVGGERVMTVLRVVKAPNKNPFSFLPAFTAIQEIRPAVKPVFFYFFFLEESMDVT